MILNAVRCPTMTNDELSGILPSGNLLLVGATVEEAWLSDNSDWLAGAVPFKLVRTLSDDAKSHFQSKGAQVDSDERASSFTPAVATTLFSMPGKNIPDDVNPSLCIERWYQLYDDARTLVSGIPPIVGLECLVLHDPGSVAKTHSAIVVVHLQGLEGCDNPGVLDGADSARQQSHHLYETIRKPNGLKKTLEALASFVGEGFDLSPRSGDRERSAFCYPVFTVMDLHADNDEHVLAARELSTLTPSAMHGSARSEEERVNRARNDLKRLSDSWCASITSRGMVFMSQGLTRHEAAPLYVSSIYADAIAATFLVRAALTELDLGAHRALNTNHRLSRLTTDLETLLQARQRFFRVTEHLSRLHLSESKILSIILSDVRDNFGLDTLEEHVAERIADLMETAALRREFAKAKLEEEAAIRQNWTNVILATLALISVPLTVLYGLIGLLNSAPRFHIWSVGGTVMIIFVGGIVILWMFLQRKMSSR